MSPELLRALLSVRSANAATRRRQTRRPSRRNVMKTSAAGHHDLKILLFRNKTEKCSMYNKFNYFVPVFRTAYSPRHSAFGRANRREKKDRPRIDGNWRAVRGINLIITAGRGVGGSKNFSTLKV